jgi:peptidoglycan hydrolase-like protein with peptidoglycan-binding domain
VFTCGLFAALAAAIAINALLLQARQHPAPLAGTREAAEPGRGDDIVVLDIQAALQAVGYYSGPLDGVAGPLTQSAIRRFEAAAKLPITGQPRATLVSIIQSHAGQFDTRSAATSSGPAAGSSAPDGRVSAIQAALARSAYGPLRADGVIGPQTRVAIMRFQRNRGLPVTGEISDDLVAELRSMGAWDAE